MSDSFEKLVADLRNEANGFDFVRKWADRLEPLARQHREEVEAAEAALREAQRKLSAHPAVEGEAVERAARALFEGDDYADREYACPRDFDGYLALARIALDAAWPGMVARIRELERKVEIVRAALAQQANKEQP